MRYTRKERETVRDGKTTEVRNNKLEIKGSLILEVMLEFNFVLFLNYQRLLTN